ncbi:hypothetical protein MBLNU459_g7496t1 [Dothideomycetes sp. NU459]
MLVVHHLGVSQSERVVWLCEELGLEYDLKLHKRDPIYSPQSIKDLHPLGQAPIIQDGSLTLAESAACVDYINFVHGGGKLALPPTHKDYPKYIYWFHFANGMLQPTMGRLMTLEKSGLDESNQMRKNMKAKMELYVGSMDKHLGEGNTWLAGDEFSAADIMSVFSLTTMRSFYQLDLSQFKNVLAYLKRTTERDSYRRAREKGDPGLPLMVDGPPPESFFVGKL